MNGIATFIGYDNQKVPYAENLLIMYGFPHQTIFRVK